MTPYFVRRNSHFRQLVQNEYSMRQPQTYSSPEAQLPGLNHSTRTHRRYHPTHIPSSPPRIYPGHRLLPARPIEHNYQIKTTEDELDIRSHCLPSSRFRRSHQYDSSDADGSDSDDVYHGSWRESVSGPSCCFLF